jgi:hypothetical protein
MNLKAAGPAGKTVPAPFGSRILRRYKLRNKFSCLFFFPLIVGMALPAVTLFGQNYPPAPAGSNYPQPSPDQGYPPAPAGQDYPQGSTERDHPSYPSSEDESRPYFDQNYAPDSPDSNYLPVCPLSRRTSMASVTTTLNIPNYLGPRRPVAGDYVVIEYNALKTKASWTDYTRAADSRGHNNFSQPIDLNGSFLPVIYTREKLAVRVCGLHFTDVLTVTTSPNAVVEGGADIRGSTPVAPPSAGSLSATLDTLQSGTPTGGTTALPGLGLSAPGALPALTVSGVTPGAISGEDQTPNKFPNYVPATVLVSGKQVALQLYSVKVTADEIVKLINRTIGIPYGEDPRYYRGPYAPGSVRGLEIYLGEVLGQVNRDDKDPTNNAAFDSDMTNIQNVNAQISTLSSALTSQTFASNTLILLSNYSALAGILDLARLGGQQENCQPNVPAVQPSAPSLDDLKKLSFNDFANWTAVQVLKIPQTDIDRLPAKDSSGKPFKAPVENLYAALQAFKGLLVVPADDRPLCSAFEKEKFREFFHSYQIKVGELTHNSVDADDFEDFVGDSLKALDAALTQLRGEVGGIDRETTDLYNTMNRWYFASYVEQTDLLPVQTQNAYLRISIVVQRGYTPFTIANAGSSITATATANVVPPTPPAASTSTPAHSVKTILVEVHRLANFNLMGGVMLIHVPTASYVVQTQPNPSTASTTSPTGYSGTCGGQTVNVPVPSGTTTPPNYSCIVQTQKTEWQVAGMAGLVWYPAGRDYFPRKSGYANFGRNMLPSLLLATSVTSLGNAMGGVNWEPISGVDFYGGIASAHKYALPSGLTVNAAVPTGYTLNTITQEHAGLALGVGLDLSVLGTLFGGKTSGASMP